MCELPGKDRHFAACRKLWVLLCFRMQTTSNDMLSSPLPLLPMESPETRPRANLAMHSLETASNLDQSHGEKEIREVSSEMPMYLLAEDEGNEEEILRLLESHPSPSLISLPSTSESMFLSSRESGQDTVRTRELGASGTDILQSVACSTAPSSLPAGSSMAMVDSSRVSFSSSHSIGPVKHGGGWPKGKSRRPPGILLPPKPPVSGYGMFLANNKAAVQRASGVKSMPVLSRRLGQMWAGLSAEEKQVFHSKAKTDQVRYLDELRKYLADSYKGIDLEKANIIISKSFEGEMDDDLLRCTFCELQFSSLHNKQTHYSGKLHLQALLQKLNELVKGDQQDHATKSLPVVTTDQSQSLVAMATEHEDMSRCVKDLLVVQDKQLADFASNQVTMVEAEYFLGSYEEILLSLRQQEQMMGQSLLQLVRVLHWFTKNP